MISNRFLVLRTRMIMREVTFIPLQTFKLPSQTYLIKVEIIINKMKTVCQSANNMAKTMTCHSIKDPEQKIQKVLHKV